MKQKNYATFISAISLIQKSNLNHRYSNN